MKCIYALKRTAEIKKIIEKHKKKHKNNEMSRCNFIKMKKLDVLASDEKVNFIKFHMDEL